MSGRRDLHESVLCERLADATGFEMYRFVSEEDEAPIATLALRHDLAKRSIEYGVWREGEDTAEPGATGFVECLDAVWSDVAREDAIRQIAYRYADDLRFNEEDLEVLLGDEDLDDAEDEDEDDADNAEDDDAASDDDDA